jgi:hypothetical protein
VVLVAQEKLEARLEEIGKELAATKAGACPSPYFTPLVNACYCRRICTAMCAVTLIDIYFIAAAVSIGREPAKPSTFKPKMMVATKKISALRELSQVPPARPPLPPAPSLSPAPAARGGAASGSFKRCAHGLDARLAAHRPTSPGS